VLFTSLIDTMMIFRRYAIEFFFFLFVYIGFTEYINRYMSGNLKMQDT